LAGCAWVRASGNVPLSFAKNSAQTGYSLQASNFGA
jgi:hypothetical protein